jgi:hypothetical protein
VLDAALMLPSSLTILLFAPRLRDEHGHQTALEARGWTVVRAGSARSFSALLEARAVDLVVLDDPTFELVKFAVTAMDAMPDPVARIWVSSRPEAPGESARLGIDALLLAPVDPQRLGDHAAALLEPRAQSSSGSHPTFPLGSQLSTTPPGGHLVAPAPAQETTVGLRPRSMRPRTDGGWEEESTGNWP